MKAAFSVWQNRIAPVFDVARRVLLVESTGGRVVCQNRLTPIDDVPTRKALQLAEMRVNTLVCGAISKPVQQIVGSYGIQIFPFVAGDLQEIIEAWQSGALDSDAYAMPGCRYRNWRHRSASCHKIQESQIARRK